MNMRCMALHFFAQIIIMQPMFQACDKMIVCLSLAKFTICDHLCSEAHTANKPKVRIMISFRVKS